MNLTVNPKFRSLIPPLASEELAQLESNILADGCRDPLVTWGGVLLDGHNRYDICRRHSLPFDTSPIDLPDENAAQVWIIRNQFGRRNLAPYTRAELALRLEPLLRVKAKENLKTSTGGSRPQPLQKSVKAETANTQKELAKAAGVSRDTIAKAKVIEAKASEETKAALRSGETSINAEYKKLTVHVGQNSGENEWYTPPEYIAAAKATMGSIDLDPASCELANRAVGAKAIFTKEDNGLTKEWAGNVWMNPPYAQPLIADFSEKLTASVESGGVKQACVLVNNATDTAWFQRMTEQASAICFPRGRVRFLDPDGKPGAPLQGQAVLYFGKRIGAFNTAFKQFGVVLCKP